MENKAQLLLIGGGGHCRSVIEAIESEGKFEIAGILDVPEKVGQTVLGYKIIGSDEDLPRFIAQIPHALITVGQLKSAGLRKKFYNQLKAAGAMLPVIIARTASVSRHASLGEGTVILHGALVNAGARIGVNNIINTAAIIEHDAETGAHCHISTAAVVNGDCRLGNEVLVGSNAVLKHGVQVADNSLIGAGAVVLQHVVTNTVMVGNPAKKL